MRRRSVSTMQESKPIQRSLFDGRIPMASLIQAVAVAEYLNFRHAANALGVSPSSMSARVKMLEQELGVLLFERHARGVRLTDAGRSFIERVSAGIDQLDHAVKAAGMAASGACGRLRIGVPSMIPGSFLAKLVGQYRKDRPGIEVEVIEGAARDALMRLRADRLDVAFVAGTPDLPDCHTQRLWAEPLVAALPDRHPLANHTAVTWADLAGETFLVRYGGTGPQVHDHIVLRLAGRWPTPSILRFDVGRSTLLSMVEQGFGITVVVAATALSPASGVVFLPITDEPEPIAFSAVWSPHNRSAALRNLLNLASEMGRESPAR